MEAKVRMANPITLNHVVKSSSFLPTVADTVFVERVKSRIKHWKKSCTDSTSKKIDGERFCINVWLFIIFSLLPVVQCVNFFVGRCSCKITAKTCLRG